MYEAFYSIPGSGDRECQEKVLLFMFGRSGPPVLCELKKTFTVSAQKACTVHYLESHTCHSTLY